MKIDLMFHCKNDHLSELIQSVIVVA
jgi:hypothetical protein